MGLPTFDLGNVLRQLKGIFLSTALNPITLITTFCATIATIVSTAWGVLSTVYQNLPSIPTLQPYELYDDGSGFVDLFLYAVNADQFVLIFNWFIRFLNALVVFVPSFFLSLLVLGLTYKYYGAFRDWINLKVHY